MNSIFNLYNTFSERKKLLFILSIALIFRLIAAVFSAGYAMHDDHFLVVETPSSWAYGFDSGSWFPETQKQEMEQGTRKELQPQGHSLFYPGLQYAFFSTMRALGIENPNIQMFFNRFAHALLGVLVVYLSYFLSTMLSTKENARSIAWIAALGWAWPFLSVRNLVEVVSIPFLLGAVILTLKGMKSNAIKLGLSAGFLMALAVSVRYQTVVFFGVLGLLMLIHKHWRLGIAIFFGFVVSFFLVQGLPDWIIWGYPFAEMLEYFGYNMSDVRFDYAESLGGRTYGVKYFPVMAFLTVPIIGAFWLFGFFYQWKKLHLLFWPSLAFLILHMSYVNTQERFIFPIMHIILILGFLGWKAFREKSNFWLRLTRFWKGLSYFSWGINFILLIFLSTYYGKKARVTSAHALYQNETVDFVFHENTIDGYLPLLPWYYAHQWDMQFFNIVHPEQYAPILNAKKDFVAWIYFQGDEDLEKRVAAAKAYFPNIRHVETFDASFLDKIIKALNPVNRNEAIVVYEVSAAENQLISDH